MFHLAFDIGGTFTDFVLRNTATGKIDIWKVPSTPKDISRAVVETIRVRSAAGEVEARAVSALFHASTVTTNTILERKGCRVALITTSGFRDIVLIGRQKRFEMSNLYLDKPSPLVERRDIFEVSERIGPNGQVRHALDLEQTQRVAKEIHARGFASVAISLLHSYSNPCHEQAVESALRSAGFRGEITLSSSVSPKMREYERTSTTVANAYVKPIVGQYLQRLEEQLADLGLTSGLSVMQSNGGVVTSGLAREQPIRLTESGPAAGVLMCAEVGRRAGWDHVITFDMGGTTAKLGAIEHGAPSISPVTEIDTTDCIKGSGLPLNILGVELLEIGSGGGSIAATHMGLISVGPESAGADPGPICYRRGGTRATITDANLVLGYLDPDYFLGGEMTLDVKGAAQGIQMQLADPLGLALHEAAWGIHSVGCSNMERALRVMSLERGRDTRLYTLVAFGGAGPLHACRLARAVGMPRVIVPYAAGVGSAMGLLVADYKVDASTTHILKLDGTSRAEIEEVLSSLEKSATESATQLPVKGNALVERSAYMHYAGQGHDIRVRLPSGPVDELYERRMYDAYQDAYRREFGYVDTDALVEVTDWDVVVSVANPWKDSEPTQLATTPHQAVIGIRHAYFPEAGGMTPSKVVDRYRLCLNERLIGPALVQERESTTVVLPGDVLYLDAQGNLVVEIEGRSHE